MQLIMTTVLITSLLHLVHGTYFKLKYNMKTLDRLLLWRCFDPHDPDDHSGQFQLLAETPYNTLLVSLDLQSDAALSCIQQLDGYNALVRIEGDGEQEVVSQCWQNVQVQLTQDPLILTTVKQYVPGTNFFCPLPYGATCKAAIQPEGELFKTHDFSEVWDVSTISNNSSPLLPQNISSGDICATIDGNGTECSQITGKCPYPTPSHALKHTIYHSQWYLDPLSVIPPYIKNEMDKAMAHHCPVLYGSQSYNYPDGQRGRDLVVLLPLMSGTSCSVSQLYNAYIKARSGYNTAVRQKRAGNVAGREVGVDNLINNENDNHNNNNNAKSEQEQENLNLSTISIPITSSNAPLQQEIDPESEFPKPLPPVQTGDFITNVNYEIISLQKGCFDVDEGVFLCKSSGTCTIPCPDGTPCDSQLQESHGVSICGGICKRNVVEGGLEESSANDPMNSPNSPNSQTTPSSEHDLSKSNVGQFSSPPPGSFSASSISHKALTLHAMIPQQTINTPSLSGLCWSNSPEMTGIYLMISMILTMLAIGQL